MLKPVSRLAKFWTRSAQLFTRPRSATLLDNVRQLMGQQAPPVRRSWCVLSRAKHDIGPHRKGLRVHRPCRRRSTGVGMHPYVAEVVTEAQCEEGAPRSVKWLTR